MLFASPAQVSLLGVDLDAVELVAIDRKAERLSEEWSDIGPHLVFADVPEQRAVVRIRRRLDDAQSANFVGAIAPGAQGAFSMRASHSAAENIAVELDATVVVISVEHDLSRSKGAVQTIACLALSADGVVDPIAAQEIAP